MLSKNREVFASLKAQLGALPEYQEFILENFFYGITPVIMKNLLEPKLIKVWFTSFQAVLQEEVTDKLFEKEEEGCLFMTITSRKQERLRSLYESLVQSNLHSTQFGAVLLKHGVFYSLSLLYRYHHKEEKEQWREGVVHPLGN